MDVGDDDLFILMMVGTHDKTDRWMRNNTFRVNAATGALEVLDVEAVRAEVEAVVASADAEKLFAHRKDKEFTQLGIDGDLVPALRAFTDEDQLLGLLGVLPAGQADALIALTGDDTVETIYAEIVGRETPAEIDVDDVPAALDAPASKSSFHVVEGQEELDEILSQPLAQWRIYLHPSQRELAYRETYRGPARVTGGAGTGKTVVAIHRAQASGRPARGPDRQAHPVHDLHPQPGPSHRAGPPEPGRNRHARRVDVVNVDRVAYRIVQDAEGESPASWPERRGGEPVAAGRRRARARTEPAVPRQRVGTGDPGPRLQEPGRLLRRSAGPGGESRSTGGPGPRCGRPSRSSRAHLIERNARTHLQLAAAAAGYVARPHGQALPPRRRRRGTGPARTPVAAAAGHRRRAAERPVHRGRQPPAHLRPAVVAVEGRHQHPGPVPEAQDQLPHDPRDPSLEPVGPRRGRLRRPRRRQRRAGLRRLPQLPASGPSPSCPDTARRRSRSTRWWRRSGSGSPTASTKRTSGSQRGRGLPSPRSSVHWRRPVGCTASCPRTCPEHPGSGSAPCTG